MVSIEMGIWKRSNGLLSLVLASLGYIAAEYSVCIAFARAENPYPCWDLPFLFLLSECNPISFTKIDLDRTMTQDISTLVLSA